MRRSQAPSARRAAKRGLPLEPEVAKEPEQPSIQMKWGTSGGYRHFGPRRYDDAENPLKDKRIFLVLWRQQSNKKHKIWTGNGTLEVTATRATLKDETNKTLDVLTCFKPEKFQENALLEIGMRDVEIQLELKTVDECLAQRKEEIENWYRQQETATGELVSQSENNSISYQRPKIMFKKPKQSLELLATTIKPITQESEQRIEIREYICMLSPTDIQRLTLQLLADHCRTLKEQSSDLLRIAQQICDHPVLLKHIEDHPFVSRILLPHLPPWQELGLYDSAKFEFVHLMLDNLVVARGEKCAIVATSQRCLDIIRGYCQCWEVPYLQVENIEHAENFNRTGEMDPLVALLDANQLPSLRLTGCKNMILYNYSTRSAASRLLAADVDTRIYTLITAGCLEERMFQQHLELVESCESVIDLLNNRVNPTKALLGVDHKPLKHWNQWEPPFSQEFLKETFQNDELTSLSFVFSKQEEVLAGSEI
ncbi:uncharacterized protein LOC133838102 [Drosophila sulfurigaster albostrigata]|uniref:uncharacterized protein LOC133838102 n=1 Tax=Drosophila sulfurigaster albostrigata TaxID=89887 RepID=UPI002D21D69B|nr:uncharacterized protein LOC133838102 [Drosophila sulfurigaster albostrigata]